MLMESHRLVSSNIYDFFKDEHGLELNKKHLLWGSVAPDFIPKYRMISHYPSESMAFVGHEVVKIFILFQTVTKTKTLSKLFIKKLSRKIGILSHFLADFSCHPHNSNLNCTSRSAARDHLTYESDLNHYARDHEFDLDLRKTWAGENFEGSVLDLRKFFMASIEEVLAEYKTKPISFAKDLDYAANLNLYILEMAYQLALESQEEAPTTAKVQEAF